MALIQCPECDSKVSDKASACPHCGFPISTSQEPVRKRSTGRPKRSDGRLRLPNGFGSIVKLSGKRRRPYWARRSQGLDLRGYPIYLTIGYFEDWDQAYVALHEYQVNPYDPKYHFMTFTEVYNLLLQEKENTEKGLSESLRYCFQSSYRRMSAMHDKCFRDITAFDLQPYLNNKKLSHATLEHDQNLINQMYKVGRKYKACEDDISQYLSIGKEDDDESGVPFTEDELALFWANKDIPGMDSILVLCYSGWRINEFLKMPVEMVDLENMVFTSGSKTDAGKWRPVPIHPKIQPLVTELYSKSTTFLYPTAKGKRMGYAKYASLFAEALSQVGLCDHTPHDTRHTFASLLDRYKANEICQRRLLGHVQKDVHEKYVHKSIEDLKEAVYLIP